jgi:hypothetical protein
MTKIIRYYVQVVDLSGELPERRTQYYADHRAAQQAAECLASGRYSDESHFAVEVLMEIENELPERRPKNNY